jgi:hypothetical protein
MECASKAYLLKTGGHALAKNTILYADLLKKISAIET